MMTNEHRINPPRLVVFEGVDGVGKSSLASALTQYCRRELPQVKVVTGSFPGTEPGSLGEWVYRLHHGNVADLSPESIAPVALQLLHVAAHMDAIESWITSALADGWVILDRYWWSTYAYARVHMSPDQAWSLVSVERRQWHSLLRVPFITPPQGAGD